jgi:site-specific DNA recombinase
VSTDQQEDDGSSLFTQEERCREYAEAQGWTVVRVVRDTASGATLARPGLTSIRESLDLYDVLLAYDFDRVSRDQVKMAVLLNDLLEAGVALWTVKDGALEDSAVGRFLLNARTFAAELEREKIAERTMRGKMEWARRGRYIGSAPYGYDRGDGCLVANEAEAHVVRRVYALYATGVGVRTIALQLDAEQAPTPRRARHWSGAMVRLILARETYTGVMTYNGIRIEDQVPVIIDRETWESTQATIARKRRTSSRVSEYLLSGILYCSECGGRMQGDRKITGRGKFLYRGYICATWHAGRGCQSNLHQADDLEARVLHDLDSAILPADTRRRERLGKDETEIGIALARTERRRDRTLDQIADGVLSGKDARDALARNDAERDSLEAERLRIEEERRELDRQAERQQDRPRAMAMLKSPDTPLAQKKAIIARYVQRVTVRPGEPEPEVE